MTIVSELLLLDVATVRDNGVPVPAYLIGLDDGRSWLVDTGCTAEMIGVPDAPFVVTEESHVTAQTHGRTLDTVIVSHLDPDHAGANDAFPGAEFVVQREQHRHATTSGLMRYEWMRQHWDGSRWRFVDGDTELAPGITLVECGGHVPGHQAVLLQLPGTGAVLLAGDAWMRDTDPDTRPLTQHDLDEQAMRRSQRKLMELAERHNALVVHNHDIDQWRTLRRRYN
jgi:N-acyl homoserine lactone hydrolase